MFPPWFTHTYVASTASAVRNARVGPFPSPAAFPLQVRPVLTDFVQVGVPMKWGLSAKAVSENPMIRHSANSRAIPYFTRCMVNLLGSMQIHTINCVHTHYKVAIQGRFL